MKALLKPELFFLVLLVFGTPLAAYWLYQSDYATQLPKLQNPERELLQPPLRLPSVQAKAGDGRQVYDVWSGSWSLVYGRSTPCDQQCFSDLIRLVQVYRSLGSDGTRVRRVYLSPGPASGVMQDENILVVRLDQGNGVKLLKQLVAVDQAPGSNGRVYLVDPNGLLVATYPASPDRQGLKDDIERLLGNT